MSLKNKRVLITAGPTWVPIDNVRVISNTSTGKTGILLAEELTRQGAKVTLLLGPIGKYCLNKKIKVIDFEFFDELSLLLKKELKKKYDAVIQAAAVADYTPIKTSKAKLSSKKDTLKLALKRTPKIINTLRKATPDSFLAGFKFEPNLSEESLVKKGKFLLKNAYLDLVVANSTKNNQYSAYLVTDKKISAKFLTKEGMVKTLADLIRKEI